jgi:protein AbiQ
MKDTKKIKLKKLNFYIIDDNYINYLSQYDKHIAYNKNQKRPYIGVIIIVKEHYYFAPLFSPKQKHKTYKDNLTFFKIINNKTRNDLGIIRFSDMIPVPQESVYLLDITSKSYGYKRLLSEQYSYINIPENKQKIIDKAEKIYNIVTQDSNSKMAKFYKKLSCNFKLLEEKSLKYNGGKSICNVSQ